jgi:hypothetical protein
MSKMNDQQIPDGDHGELPDYSEESGDSKIPSVPWFADSKKRRWILRALLALALLLVAPPLYRLAKEWRSGALIREAGTAFALGDSNKGVLLLKQALALSPGSATVVQAVELHNARAGDQPSLAKLLERMRAGRSDPNELLGLAELSVAGSKPGDADVAGEVLTRLPKNLPVKLALRRTLIEAALQARQGDYSRAADACLVAALHVPKEDAAHLRFQAAMYLLANPTAESGRKAVNLLKEVLSGNTGTSLSAWRLLAGIALLPPGQSPVQLTPAESVMLIKTLPSLKQVIPADEFLAADMEILHDPAGKDKVVRGVMSRYQSASRVEMLDAAKWLNRGGFHKEVVEFAGSELPLKDTDWLLVVMDALSAEGNWNEVLRMLDSPAGSGIPDAVKHLYRARIAIIAGNKTLSEEEWRNVGGSLNLEKTETLAYIAGYEEQIGETARAARTYRELANRKETQAPGLIGLIRCQPRSASASTLIPLYEELLAAQPGHPDAACDLAYLKLLTGKEAAESAALAEKLLTQQQDSLPRISTAALGRLRLGDAKGALEIYGDKVIDWNAAPDPWKVVRCAVLKVNGQSDQAATLAASVSTQLLRPEEKELLTKPPVGR